MGKTTMYLATEEICFPELDDGCLPWLDGMSMYVGQCSGQRLSFSQYLLSCYSDSRLHLYFACGNSF